MRWRVLAWCMLALAALLWMWGASEAAEAQRAYDRCVSSTTWFPALSCFGIQFGGIEQQYAGTLLALVALPILLAPAVRARWKAWRMARLRAELEAIERELGER